MQRRFTNTAFIVTGAMLIWLATFVTVYVFGALACAYGYAHAEFLGVRLVPLFTTLSCAVAAATIVLLARRTAQRDSDRREIAQFVRFLSIASAGLAIVALVWVALPGWLTACST